MPGRFKLGCLPAVLSASSVWQPMFAQRPGEALLGDLRRLPQGRCEPPTPPKSAEDAGGRETSDLASATASARQIEVVELQRCKDLLRAEVEELRHENSRQRSDAERRAGRDAECIARLRHNVEQLAKDVLSRKRTSTKLEEKLQRGTGTEASVRQDLLELTEELENQKSQAETKRRRLDDKVDHIGVELSAARNAAIEAMDARKEADARACEADASRERVLELEQTVASLRLSLEQSKAEVELAAQVRKQHAEYDAELRSARASANELQELRARILTFEHEDTRLRSAIVARDAVLQTCEEAASGGALAKRDCAAFSTAAAPIVLEAWKCEGKVFAPDCAVSMTPLELSLAWTRLSSLQANDRKRCIELERERKQAERSLNELRAEVSSKTLSLATSQASAEQAIADLRQARDEVASLQSRVDVLRSLARQPVSGA